MRKKISVDDVATFKKSCCNENSLIAELIKHEIQNEFQPPILDVGCGTGDIAHWALEKKEVIGLDVNYADPLQFPLRANHSRINGSFFDYQPPFQISTVFISHTLQFLDDDVLLLNRQIAHLSPLKIICILNRNDDFLGTLITWARENFSSSHPEVRLPDFPVGYTLKKSIPFTATLACLTFEELIQQIGYLLLIDFKGKESQILSFVQHHLNQPLFSINQDILIYEK